MSGPHATISAWSRNGHEGVYQAELHDWSLRVSWSPNTPTTRGAFRWQAERDGADEHAPELDFEEIELAMAAAESFAKQDADAHAAAAASGESDNDSEDSDEDSDLED